MVSELTPEERDKQIAKCKKKKEKEFCELSMNFYEVDRTPNEADVMEVTCLLCYKQIII